MSKLQEPFRYDHVGSFLRTEELKKATTQYNENKITKEAYDNMPSLSKSLFELPFITILQIQKPSTRTCMIQ